MLQCLAYRIERIVRRALRPEPKRIRLEVRLKQRFQQQLHRCLDDTVANVGNAQRALPTIQLRDVGMYTRRTGPGRYVFVFSSSRSSSSSTSRPHASSCSKVMPSGPGAPPFALASAWRAQDVGSVHLVVEGVCPEVRFLLGSQVECPLQVPDVSWGF